MRDKLEYVTPALVEAGSFEALTQGQSDGSVLDAVFPSGAPKGELTFSDVPA
ncbi:lasso RiPP family leader peptide-containing protein [Sphingomonas koreensis]|nr:lasso RiPP family leader peptide-containing protein [Sphingomonas koreensis]